MQHPLQLVRVPSRGKLEVDKDTLGVLRSLPNLPVRVAAVAGNMREGKSILLNKVFGIAEGFNVGNAVQACTKGIWVWAFYTNSAKQSLTIVLDTEGLGDPDNDDPNFDITIFSLAVLLGSLFIYNCKGVINNDAIQKLNLVLNLSKHLSTQPEGQTETGENFDQIFPALVFVIRDFCLDLIQNGKSLTADEYFENLLALKRGFAPGTAEYNDVRRCLTNFFRNRKCFLLPAPTSSAKMTQVSTMPESELDPLFVEHMKELADHVVHATPIKTILVNTVQDGVTTSLRSPLTVTTFLSLAEHYVDAINNNVVPRIPDMWSQVVESENRAVSQKAVESYQSEMEAFTGDRFKSGKPFEEHELHGKHQEAFDRAIASFTTHAIGDVASVIAPAQHALRLSISSSDETGTLRSGIFALFQAQNDELSLGASRKFLKDLFDRVIQKKISDNAYVPPKGNVNEFQKDMTKLLTSYAQVPTGPLKRQAEAEFMVDRQRDHENLLNMNQLMTEKEKQLARAREAELQEKVLREAQQAANQRMEAQMIENQHTFEAQKTAIFEKAQEERALFMAENEKVMMERLHDQEELLRKGFKDDANMLTDQIKELTAANEANKQRHEEIHTLLTQNMAETQRMLKAILDRPPQQVIVEKSKGGGCVLM